MPQHRCGRLRPGILVQVVLCLAPPGSRPDARCDAPAINCSEKPAAPSRRFYRPLLPSHQNSRWPGETPL